MIGHADWCAITPTHACTCGGYYPDASAAPTLANFLHARITEDEADVRDPAAALHFAPPRVLAECQAKRRIVDRAVAAMYDGSDEDGELMTSGAQLGYNVLLALALPYADHPYYREEWKR